MLSSFEPMSSHIVDNRITPDALDNVGRENKNFLPKSDTKAD